MGSARLHTTPVMVRHANDNSHTEPLSSLAIGQILPIYQDECKVQARARAITALDQPGVGVVDECAVSNYEVLNCQL